MKKEIIGCLTWYANSVSETTQYESWDDEFCRKRIKKSTDALLDELKNHIDWDNLTEEEGYELRFRRWSSDKDIDEEIDYVRKKGTDEAEIQRLVEGFERTKGLWLIPLYLLPIVPKGTELISICGEVVKYDGTNVDNDIRCGCIAYGIKLKK